MLRDGGRRSHARGWVPVWAAEAERAAREHGPLAASLCWGAARFPCPATPARRDAHRRQLECYLEAAPGFRARFRRELVTVPDGDTTGLAEIPGTAVWLVRGATHCAPERFRLLIPAVQAWPAARLPPGPAPAPRRPRGWTRWHPTCNAAPPENATPENATGRPGHPGRPRHMRRTLRRSPRSRTRCPTGPRHSPAPPRGTSTRRRCGTARRTPSRSRSRRPPTGRSARSRRCRPGSPRG